MAKRMKFSVFGLPHYTVWHLYEPSVDDIRHMEEMEQERKNREQEEKDRADRMKKIKDEFNEPSNQWEKDKTELQDIAAKEEESRKKESSSSGGNEEGPAAEPVKETAPSSSSPMPEKADTSEQIIERSIDQTQVNIK